MQNLIIEWEALRMALTGWVRSGRTLKSLSDQTGVSRPTLVNWLEWQGPPETIAKGAAVMETIENERAGTTEG